jgi:hypothetical protein
VDNWDYGDALARRRDHYNREILGALLPPLTFMSAGGDANQWNSGLLPGAHDREYERLELGGEGG